MIIYKVNTLDSLSERESERERSSFCIGPEQAFSISPTFDFHSFLSFIIVYYYYYFVYILYTVAILLLYLHNYLLLHFNTGHCLIPVSNNVLSLVKLDYGSKHFPAFLKFLVFWKYRKAGGEVAK